MKAKGRNFIVKMIMKGMGVVFAWVIFASMTEYFDTS